MRKIQHLIIGALVATLFISGCGGKTKDDTRSDTKKDTRNDTITSLEIQKDETIVELINEDFSDQRYVEDGLKSMILSEVAAFNNDQVQGNISVEKLEEKEGIISVVLKYENAQTYTAYNTNEYNPKTLFVGTIKQAFESGHSLDITIKNVKNGETISKDELMQMGENHIVIASEPMKIKLFGRILYTGDHVVVEGKESAIFSGGEKGDPLGQYYIVFK